MEYSVPHLRRLGTGNAEKSRDEMTTTAVLNDQNWECRPCRFLPPDDTEKNFPSCKILKVPMK